MIWPKLKLFLSRTWLELGRSALQKTAQRPTTDSLFRKSRSTRWLPTTLHQGHTKYHQPIALLLPPQHPRTHPTPHIDPQIAACTRRVELTLERHHNEGRYNSLLNTCSCHPSSTRLRPQLRYATGTAHANGDGGHSMRDRVRVAGVPRW